MRDLSSPIANRGPEALQQLLVSGAAAAHEQLRSLTLSELIEIAAAADELAVLARFYTNRICGVCGAPIVWYANEPTGQAQGWRHVDQPAYYRLRREHRATPNGGESHG